MLYELFVGRKDALLGIEPEFLKDLCVCIIIKKKIIGNDLPHNVIRYGSNLLLPVFTSYLFLKFNASEFQQQPDDLFFGIVCHDLLLYLILYHQRRNRKIFRTGL